MHVLTKGANVPVNHTALRAVLSWRPGPGCPDVDVSALLLVATGKVRDDKDFVFFNQPQHPSRSVRHGGKDAGRDCVDVDFTLVEPDVSRIVLAASADGGSFGEVADLAIALVDAGGSEFARFPMSTTTETAFIAGELYRRGDGWKFRAVGQGYAQGLAGLATDFGISVDDEPAPPPAGPSMVKGAEKLPPDMRKRLDLRKQQVTVSLRKAGATQAVVARVMLALDASGSMRHLYSRGTVAKAVERVAAVAAALDDDATLQAWIFAAEPARLPDLQVGDLPAWLALHIRELLETNHMGQPIPEPLLPGQIDMVPIGAGNIEFKMVNEIRRYVFENPLDVPTLVLFFSDGGVWMNDPLEAELRAAEAQPIFWQFVGLGNLDFGVLEQFDTMPGRRVDNVGFFAVDDIDKVSDEELYDRVLQEFPTWIAAAAAADVRNDVFGEPPAPEPQRRRLFGRFR